jgi:hypothetical protein
LQQTVNARIGAFFFSPPAGKAGIKVSAQNWN